MMRITTINDKDPVEFPGTKSGRKCSNYEIMNAVTI